MFVIRRVTGNNRVAIGSAKMCDDDKKPKKPKKPPGRPMKYPYTFTAKVVQFPWKFYIKNQWIWRYYFMSLVVCTPIFYYLTTLANSPANVAKWEEVKKKEREEHLHK